MEKMTREQMIAEFGEPGVQNPAIVDLIELDRETGHVVLAMIERRGWECSPGQFKQIEEKLNRYMGYVLDGHLTSHYPQYEGRPVRIRLDCVHAPAGEAVAFLNAAQHSVRQYGLEFLVKIIPQR